MDISNLVTELLTIAVLLLLQVAGGAVIRWLRARYSAEQIASAMEVARIAVRAVEQMAAATGWDRRGREKLDEAIGRAREIAAQRGLRLTDEQWRTVIEAAVLELRRLGEELRAPAPAS